MKIDNECFILDIGLGNLKSIENKFYKEGLNPIISSDPFSYTHLTLPTTPYV